VAHQREELATRPGKMLDLHVELVAVHVLALSSQQNVVAFEDVVVVRQSYREVHQLEEDVEQEQVPSLEDELQN
jgi:hypothetical protein